jgi:hypothetical protein
LPLSALNFVIDAVARWLRVAEHFWEATSDLFGLQILDFMKA